MWWGCQYVGHFLPSKLFLYVNQRGWETVRWPGSSHWALRFWKRNVYFSASVSVPLRSAVILKILFGQTHVKLLRLKSHLFELFVFLEYLLIVNVKDLMLSKYEQSYLCPVPRSVEYPSWDWRESRDFDELNHILQESKKLGKALESLSRSECTQTPWAVLSLSSHSELNRRPFCKCHWKSTEETGSSS